MPISDAGPLFVPPDPFADVALEIGRVLWPLGKTGATSVELLPLFAHRTPPPTLDKVAELLAKEVRDGILVDSGTSRDGRRVIIHPGHATGFDALVAEAARPTNSGPPAKPASSTGPAARGWEADVPFPAEDMTQCRGCDRRIGFIRKNDDEKPHPVNVNGWAGIRETTRGPTVHAGYTLDGLYARVVEAPPYTPASALVVVFESHFSTCPKAARFRR